MIDFERLKNDKIAVCFESREELIAFLKQCDKQNIVWQDGEKATSMDDFFTLKQDEFCIGITDELVLFVDQKFSLIRAGYDIESYSDLMVFGVMDKEVEK